MTDPQTATPLDQALEWCVRLADPGVTVAQRRAFERWLAADELHAQAWQRAQQVWQAAGPAAERSAARRPLAPRRRARLAGFASAALVLLGLLLWNLDPARHADYRTDVAQVRSWTLDDGSTVQLAPHTALDVRYSEGERRIRLYRGEAWFQVAGNPQRPFIVESAGGTTHALGTAFDVRVLDDGAQVSVTEHVVRINQGQQQLDLASGQAVRYGADGIGSPIAFDVEQLSWREQRLSFRNQPLQDVIARLQPYSRAHLMLFDEGLKHLPVTASVRTSEADAALRSLQVVLPVQVTEVGPWLTLIRPAKTPAEKR
ncbi:FecR family protein [Pseudomonas cremoricolorata]|uniref:Iron dicitrate transport regulator FecR n=1 Tax=Pseudomonas cremoricolorata TaxID=157783 RepID=A0A089YCA0_9PSED|nr:FecR family protein [Pseudomonas cremoricolorata]AIR89433.1 hypothetical protein LK03_09135 [Pseudomonas cremoricolorata]